MELVGDFNGNSLVQDPETGFLAGKFLIKSNQAVEVKDKTLDVERDRYGRFIPGVGGYPPVPVFDLARKLQVLNHLWDVWPDVSLACRMVGVSRMTYENHKAIDQSFRECVEEIEHRHIDDVEGVRFKIARTVGGSLDRMAVMNAYRRERYNPKIDIEVKHTMSPQEARDTHRRMEQAVDAEVIETVHRLKAQARKTTRPQNPT